MKEISFGNYDNLQKAKEIFDLKKKEQQIHQYYDGNNNENVDLEHGIIIVATGAHEYTPKEDEFLFGKDNKVILQSELEKILFKTKY